MHKEDNRIDDSMMVLMTNYQKDNPGKIKVLRNDFTKHYQPMVDKDMAAGGFGPVLYHQGSLKVCLPKH
jgi:hypothetical protein